MLKTERQEKILAEISNYKTVSVGQLSEALNVSEITIRRDLDNLDKLGKIRRVHGGASLMNPYMLEPPVVQRQNAQVAEKEAIARLAVNHVIDGQAIALESGSTTLALAKQISSSCWENLQVVTNSVTILNHLLPNQGVRIVFVGGLVDPDELSTYGLLTEEGLKHLHIDTYFCGCRGLHPRFGRSNEIQTGIEIGTVQAFASASSLVIILADHTKMGKMFPLQLLRMDEINVVITSTLTPNTLIEEIRQQGVTVEKAALD